MADFELIGPSHATVLLLQPRTKEAHEFLQYIAPEDSQWFGDGLAIKHNFVIDFCTNLMADGFSISHSGALAQETG